MIVLTWLGILSPAHEHLLEHIWCLFPFFYFCYTEHDVHISPDLVNLYEQYAGAVFEDIHKLNTQSPIHNMEGIKVSTCIEL